MNKKGMGTLAIVLIILAVIILGFFVMPVIRWVYRAREVVEDEISPAELLRKYEWFKDASAQLDKKKADISIYQSRLEALKESYGNVSRLDWDRTDKEDFNQWVQEVAGVKAGYNSLAADYNAQMAKMNWRFTNVGMLPEGATETLQREFRQYEVG